MRDTTKILKEDKTMARKVLTYLDYGEREFLADFHDSCYILKLRFPTNKSTTLACPNTPRRTTRSSTIFCESVLDLSSFASLIFAHQLADLVFMYLSLFLPFFIGFFSSVLLVRFFSSQMFQFTSLDFVAS